MSFRPILPLLAAAAVLLPGCGALSDEFDDPSTLESWGYFEGDYGRNRFMIERNRRGELDVMPSRSAWSDADRAFYLYKQVNGDFDVSMRLRVSGREGAKPSADWSLSGLLVRARPEEDGDPENWVALRVGAVDDAWTFERKTTLSSRSELVLDPAGSGWNDLRIIRRGERFTLLRRRPGGAWQRHWTYERPDLPLTLQVGIDAFSGYGEAKADLVSHVDWIRFRPAA